MALRLPAFRGMSTLEKITMGFCSRSTCFAIQVEFRGFGWCDEDQGEKVILAGYRLLVRRKIWNFKNMK